VARHSPCIGICRLDDATGFCLGCGRTGKEVGDWIAMTEVQRDAVWQELPQRLSKLSVRVRLLPWVREELVNWIRDTVVMRQGTWTVGAPGALAEFPTSGTAPINGRADAGVVTAERSDSALRLVVTEKVRAFAFAGDGPIVLGLPKGRAEIQSGSSLQACGADTGAIDEAKRGDTLFDLGVGRRYSRFCVRTQDEALITMLTSQVGRHWSDALPAIQQQLIDSGPHRVVESAAARIEVFAKIPRPGESSPSGALAQFLPEFLKSGEEIAASIAPPDYAAPVAIFYPSKS
jgi:predicted Fe-S protein YdhL (DUF1289 family)